MATLRPPSTSPSPSPAPGNGPSTGSRASLGPTARLGRSPAGGQPASPRPSGFVGSARPTSELPPGVNGTPTFQTPETDAIDRWFERHEATLEDMAAASLDLNFKEELSAIENWFRVLSEAERTAALYSLIQHSTPLQIRFFITVLQQMAHADPMTAALLSPGMGGKSMEQQMEQTLAQLGLKSPGLKTPASPSARTFGNMATKRQSLTLDNTSNYLSPDSAALATGGDAAATLAAQRAKLNAAHRISAPPLAVPADGRSNYNNQLGQVSESTPPADAQELTIPAPNTGIRPKSTDFSGLASALSPRLNRSSEGSEEIGGLSPMPTGKNWASMVNTPMDTLFPPNKPVQSLDLASQKLANWSGGDSTGRIMLEGADKFKLRRNSARSVSGPTSGYGGGHDQNEVYDDNGNLLGQSNSMGSIPQGRKTSGSIRSTSGGSNFGGQSNWNGGPPIRSPALSNTSGRFDDGTMSGLGLGVGGFNLGGGMSPGLGMGMPTGFPAVSPLMGGAGFDMNMLNNMAGLNLNGMGGVGSLNALNMANQQLAVQMMAAQLQNQQGYNMQQQQYGGLRPRAGRAPGSQRPAMSDRGKSDTADEVDPKVLEDVPAWLRSLRLHKYTPNFEGSNWKEMVLMDEAALEAKGVAALGARRKMLKTFELVRNKMNFHPLEKASSPSPAPADATDAADSNAKEAAAPAEVEPAAAVA